MVGRTGWVVGLLLLIILVPAVSVASVDGDLDPAFGTGGISYFDSGEGLIYIEGVVDGSTIYAAALEQVGAERSFVLSVIAEDGSQQKLKRYSGTLVETYEFVPYGISLDAEGRLLVVGQVWNVPGSALGDIGLLRLRTDGSLDASFGGTGVVSLDLGSQESGTDVTVDSLGRILVAYDGRPGAVRFLDDGTLDSSFGTDGVATYEDPQEQYAFSVSVAVDSADRPVVAYKWEGPAGGAVVRFDESGVLDSTFGTNGRRVVPFAPGGYVRDIALDSVGRIVAVGNTEDFSPDGPGDSLAAARLDSSGNLDKTFGTLGITYVLRGAEYADTRSVVVDADDRVVATGYVSRTGEINVVVFRLSVDGQPDAAFSDDGVVEIPDRVAGQVASGESVDIDDQGRIVMVGRDSGFPNNGNQSLMVARFLTSGSGSFVGTFSDDDGSIFEPDIEWLAVSGITKGCNPPTNDLFCPNNTVTRGQMAAFLHRALPDLLEIRPAIDFTDDDESVFEGDIEWLYSRGVTQGTSPTTFAPDRPVTRGQMAAFLVRALKYSDNGGGDLFIDDDTSQFEGDIDRLGTAGVTRGCNPPTNDRFCPDGFVTRGQMAAFLHRALGG